MHGCHLNHLDCGRSRPAGGRRSDRRGVTEAAAPPRPPTLAGTASRSRPRGYDAQARSPVPWLKWVTCAVPGKASPAGARTANLRGQSSAPRSGAAQAGENKRDRHKREEICMMRAAAIDTASAGMCGLECCRCVDAGCPALRQVIAHVSSA
eukprot:354196-Chlamydomonas_euryale.AAC.8